MKDLYNNLGEHQYFESSSAYKEGFKDALDEILKKSEEEGN